MSILIDLVPMEVSINGKVYKINSDFRTSILFEELMLDENISDEIRFMQALKLYYPTLLPIEDLDKALEKILWFYSCGKEEESSTNNGNSTCYKQIYSYEYDDEYIYSAFLSQYDIDLQDIKYLHWWKFKALFKGLTEENKLIEIMKYRATDLSKIKDKEEQKFYKEMQKIYNLPENINKADEEKIKTIEEALMGDGVLNFSEI